MGTLSNSNTFERKRSTPNNTLRHIQSQDCSEKPKITVGSAATLERLPKVFVHRSVELLQERGIAGNITGRNRQSCQDERMMSTPSLSSPIATPRPDEHTHEVQIIQK